MKALVICPAERSEVPALSESVLLGSLRVFGQSFLAHWLESLALNGFRQVHLLTPAGGDQIHAELEGGLRWGVELQVSSEACELPHETARLKYRLGAQDQIFVANHLPGSSDRDIFSSYADFFAGLLAWMPTAARHGRVGLKQLRAGIWVGLHSRISPRAILSGPLWIGEDVYIKKDVVLGPNAIVEDRAVIEAESEVTNSLVGLETYVGLATRVRRSLAIGNTLVNWKSNSVAKICDPFLLGVLGQTPVDRRIAELSALAADRVRAPAKRTAEPEAALSESIKLGNAG